jgi:hypothetical protein
LKPRGDEITRRGLRNFNELEAVNVLERKDAIGKQFNSVQASSPSAAQLPFLDAAVLWADMETPNEVAQEVAAHWQDS